MDQKRPVPDGAALAALTAFHVIAVILGCLVSADQPAVSSALFLALVFCQTSLLGMWGGFGAAPWFARLIGVTVGMVVLWAVLGTGIGELDAEIFLLVSVATWVVALTTWIVRLFRARLGRVYESAAAPREGLQFTIRHLMLLTLAVACLVTAGKLLAPFVRGSEMVATIVVLGLCFASVAVASIWAILGSGRPALRIIPVLGIAGASGWIAAASMNGSEQPFWISLSFLQATFFLATLGVIRWSGYRLLAR